MSEQNGQRPNNGSDRKGGLEWKPLETFTAGNVQAILNGATTREGKRLYSVKFGKLMDNGGGSPFFRVPEDLRTMAENVDKVSREIELWVDADREETRKKGENQKGRKHHRQTAS